MNLNQFADLFDDAPEAPFSSPAEWQYLANGADFDAAVEPAA